MFVCCKKKPKAKSMQWRKLYRNFEHSLIFQKTRLHVIRVIFQKAKKKNSNLELPKIIPFLLKRAEEICDKSKNEVVMKLKSKLKAVMDFHEFFLHFLSFIFCLFVYFFLICRKTNNQKRNSGKAQMSFCDN